MNEETSLTEQIEDAHRGPRNIKKMRAEHRENPIPGHRKRPRPTSKSSESSCETRSSKPQRKPLELETDQGVLQRRQKQIDYGKNTVGYHNYTQQVPIDKRTKECPRTPDKFAKYSRRSWDMLIKIWRRQLHEYDPKIEGSNVEPASESVTPDIGSESVTPLDSDDDSEISESRV